MSWLLFKSIRSSTWFVVGCMTFAIFADIFLYAFVIPILPYMLEVRNGVLHEDVQLAASNILGFYGFAMVVLSPIIGILVEKYPYRKGPLLIGMVAQVLTTIMTACSRKLYLLYIARVLQGISAASVWVTGMATITDTVGSGRMGVTLGIVCPVVHAGMFIGPMVAGFLLEHAGYWQAWSVAIGICVVDVFLRLLVIERPRTIEETEPWTAPTRVEDDFFGYVPPSTRKNDDCDCADRLSIRASLLRASSYATISSSSSSDSNDSLNSIPTTPYSPATETSPLMSHCATPLCSACAKSKPVIHPPVSDLGFFVLLFSQRRIIAVLLLIIVGSITTTSFDTTLAIHVKTTFGWGSAGAGSMYLALLAPGVLISPLVGHLRDKIGSRWPTVACFAGVAPMLVLMGIAGDKRFPWACGDRGRMIYIGAAAMFSLAFELLSGVSSVEGTLVVDVLEKERPGIFGANGGYARLFGMTSTAWQLGTFIGPYVAGILTLKVGYVNMSISLAFICLLSAIAAYLFVGPRQKKMDTEEEDDSAIRSCGDYGCAR